MEDLSTTVYGIEETKVNIDGIDISYVRTGKGKHAVLLLIGMMGSKWIHFRPQIENLNKEKLTIIGWDPPGYGKSRPPNRTFLKNFYEKDAILAYDLMKALGFDKFSLLGYSGGGTTALILAAMYPENVQKMIVIAPHPYITPSIMEMLEELRDINNWSEKERIEALDVYGEKYLQDTLNSCMDAMKYIFENNDGDICKEGLSKIKCPTLVVRGETDKLVPRDNPNYFQTNIRNSKLVTFQGSTHCPHLKYPDEFNALVHEFLIDEE